MSTDAQPQSDLLTVTDTRATIGYTALNKDRHDPGRATKIDLDLLIQTLERMRDEHDRKEAFIRVYGADMPVYVTKERDSDLGLALAPRIEREDHE